MNSSELPEEDAPLSSVLREWTLTAQLPPRFQEQVWNRIAGTEAKPDLLRWPELLRSLVQSFARPKVAYAYVSALTVFGVAAGLWTAQVTRSRLERDLVHRYVQSIDPFQVAASNQ